MVGMGSNVRKVIRLLALAAAASAVVALAGACRSQPASPAPGSGRAPEQPAQPTAPLPTVAVSPRLQATPETRPAVTPADCPKLDSALLQVVRAPDPAAQARQLGLRLKDDKVQVWLVLAHEDATFLKGFDAEVGKQSGTDVQAFVPLSRLCELARQDPVLAIRRPAEAVPM